MKNSLFIKFAWLNPTLYGKTFVALQELSNYLPNVAFEEQADLLDNECRNYQIDPKLMMRPLMKKILLNFGYEYSQWKITKTRSILFF